MPWTLSSLVAVCPAVTLLAAFPPPPPPTAADDGVTETSPAEDPQADAAEGEPEPDETLPVVEPEPGPASQPEPAPNPARRSKSYAPEPLPIDGEPSQADKDAKVGRSLKITGTVINAVGGGLLLGAGVLFVMRHRSVNDLDAAAADADPTKREGPVKEIEQREQLALTLTIAAGATLVVGTTLYVIGLRRVRRGVRDRRAALPTPFMGRGTAGLAWEGRF